MFHATELKCKEQVNSGTFNYHLDINLNYKIHTVHKKGVATLILENINNFKIFTSWYPRKKKSLLNKVKDCKIYTTIKFLYIQ